MTQEKHSQKPESGKVHQGFAARTTRRHRLWIIALFCLILFVYQKHASIYSMPPNEDCMSDLSAYTKSIFLPYTKPFSSDEIPMVWTTVNGVKIEMPVDTGSTGLLIGAPVLPDVDPTEGSPARHFFTSSKILYIGRYVDLSVAFHGSGETYAVARLPVLIVDKSFWCGWYDPRKDGFACPPGPNGEEPEQRDTSNITYMGVGFGRNQPGGGQPGAVPAKNAFLNVVSIDDEAIPPGSLRQGYSISTEGVYIGLTKDNTQGFSFTKLQRGRTHDQDKRDWALVKMCFSLNGEGSHCGPALIDTGVSQMYIRAREGVSIPSVIIKNPNPHGRAEWVERVKPGTQIDVGFPCFCEHQVAGYNFAVGEESAMAPRCIIPGRKTPGAFVNTGRNFLFGYSIAFDAEGGRFGFQAVDASPATGEESLAPKL